METFIGGIFRVPNARSRRPLCPRTAAPDSPSKIGVLEIFDLIAQNRSDVEPAGHFPAEIVAIAPSDLPVAFALFAVHSLRGQTVLVRRARLYFDETISVPFQGDDVRLAEGGNVIAFENFIAVLFEIFYGDLFSGLSKKFFTKVFL